MISPISVVSLDLDGVLFDGPSAAYPLAKALGIGELFANEYTRFSEENLTLEESLVQGARLWKGVAAYGDEIEEFVNEIPLMKGAEEVILTLKEWGYEVGCISSGVSQFFMNPFMDRLDLDFAYSNILEEKNGVHTGEIKYIMKGPQKAERILEYLTKTGKKQSELASVGDGLNDLDIFGVSAISIAFNPAHLSVGKAATYTIHSKDLRDILPHLEPKP